MSRIGLVGAAGGVGAVAAAALVADDRVEEIVLVDRARDRLAVQAMDLRMLATGIRERHVALTVAGPERLARTDVVLCAAGVPHRDGEPRSAFAVENWELYREVLSGLPDAWAGLVVVATNPVDVLATLLARHGPPAAEVVGLVANDGLRMAGAFAEVIGVPAQRVDLPVIGEHGAAPIPLWQRLRVGGRPHHAAPYHRQAALAAFQAWYPAWQAHATGTTSQWTTGHHLARTALRWIPSVPDDRAPRSVRDRGARRRMVHHAPVTEVVSVDVSGEFGRPCPVHLGVPAELVPGRVERCPLELDGEQWQALRAAVEAVEGQAEASHAAVAGLCTGERS